jgi:hypothetical protein
LKGLDSKEEQHECRVKEHESNAIEFEGQKKHFERQVDSGGTRGGLRVATTLPHSKKIFFFYR